MAKNSGPSINYIDFSPPYINFAVLIPLYPAYASILFFDGYTSLPLVNRGTGKNCGVEMTLEKRFSKDYFLLLTGALYEAKYRGSDGVERDSRLNGNFNSTVLAGKEFRVGKKRENNTIGASIRSSWSGNQRYTPINLPLSIENGYGVRLLEDVYTEKYPNYYRLDLQLSFRKNKPNRTSEWEAGYSKFNKPEKTSFMVIIALKLNKWCMKHNYP